jgi:transcriptional regulator with XRE-family HTH domain
MENNSLKNFGQRLKSLRMSQGLNQTQFAKMVNLTQAAISQFEDGKRIPSSGALQKISIGLGISLDELIENPPSQSDSGNPEKDEAMRALFKRLQDKSFDAEAIMALNRFVKKPGSDDK